MRGDFLRNVYDCGMNMLVNTGYLVVLKIGNMVLSHRDPDERGGTVFTVGCA